MENIMLQDDRKERIIIVDFGLSNLYDDTHPLKTQCGSPEYAAPELFVKGKKYGPEVDLWSLGVIVFVMGVGRLPFTSPHNNQTTADERRRRLMAQINQGLGPQQERAIADLSAEYRHLVARLLTPVAQRRISVREVCRHPWLIGKKPPTSDGIEEQKELDDIDHKAIIDELTRFTNLNRQVVEMDITKKRFGKLGGIYNIMAHEVQRNNLSPTFRKQCSSATQTLKRNLNQSHFNSNNCRNKVTQTPSNMLSCTRKDVSGEIQPKDSFSIVKYDRSSKKVTQPISISNRMVSKKAGNLMNCIPLPNRKSANTNSKKVDEKPTSQLYPKHVSQPEASFQNHFRRPFSEQLGRNRPAKPNAQLCNKKCSQSQRSVFFQKTAQDARTTPTCVSRQSRSASATASGGAIQSTTAATFVGQGKDRLADRRSALPRLTRDKTDERVKSTMDVTKGAKTTTVTKLMSETESGGVQYHLKRSRSITKGLDKLKWKNYITQQDSLDSYEKKKNFKTKMETLVKKNSAIPSILNDIKKKTAINVINLKQKNCNK